MFLPSFSKSSETLFICWWKPWTLQLHTTCAVLNLMTSSFHSRKLFLVWFYRPLKEGNCTRTHRIEALLNVAHSEMKWCVSFLLLRTHCALLCVLTAGDILGWVEGEVLYEHFLLCDNIWEKIPAISFLAVLNLTESICNSWWNLLLQIPLFPYFQLFLTFLIFHIWTCLELFSSVCLISGLTKTSMTMSIRQTGEKWDGSR